MSAPASDRARSLPPPKSSLSFIEFLRSRFVSSYFNAVHATVKNASSIFIASRAEVSK